MKKLRRWFLRIFGLVLVLLVLFVSVEHFRGRIGLAAKLKELGGNKEKLTVAELIPTRSSREQNAALDILSATNLQQNARDIVGELPPIMKLAAPGKAIVTLWL